MARQLTLVAALLTLSSACGDGTRETPIDAGFVPPQDASAPIDVGTVVNATILVKAVFDGDTLVVSAGPDAPMTPDGLPMNDEIIRFLGVDAPEIAHPPAPADCWGDEAHDAAKDLLQGRRITLEYDLEQVRDSTSRRRLLAYIKLPDGRFANEILIEEGHANSFRSFPHRFTDRYNALEAAARTAGRGKWAVCN